MCAPVKRDTCWRTTYQTENEGQVPPETRGDDAHAVDGHKCICGTVLSGVRQVVIVLMAKPVEVLIVEGENGDGNLETTRARTSHRPTRPHVKRRHTCRT